jgi:hypothetical protein
MSSASGQHCSRILRCARRQTLGSLAPFRACREWVCLSPAPAPSDTDWYAIVSARPAFRAGLRSLSGMELVEFRMTVYAAIWGGNGNVSAPIPHKLKGLLMAAAAESLLRDNAPAESAPVMM